MNQSDTNNKHQHLRNVKFVVLVLALLLSADAVYAWSNPPAGTPPTCPTGQPGCDAPLNVSGTFQSKDGNLMVNAAGSYATGFSVPYGNVGIGTASPGAKLQVSAGDSSLSLFGPNASWGGYLFVGAGPTQITGQRAQVISTNGNLHLDSAPTSYATYINYYSQTPTYINAQGGNVGIGKTNPGYKLDVNGSINATSILVNGVAISGSGGTVNFNLLQPTTGNSPNTSYSHYGIYEEPGAWNGSAIRGFPYPDLVLAYHTGMSYVAYYGYGGHRFYTGYTGDATPTTLSFSVGEGDGNTRVYGNLYVSGTAYANGGQALCQVNGTNCPSGAAFSPGTSYTWTGLQYFQTNNGGYAVNNSSSAALQAYSTGNNSAFMSFHKGGYYAVNFGLDADNVLRIGGWSAAANRWQLDMSGNETLAGGLYASDRVQTPIFYDSNNTGYYVDPSSSSRMNQLYYVDSAYIVDVRPQYMYDWNDSAYYIDMNNTSRLNYLGRNYGWNWTEYDWNNTAYYMDLDQVSILNDLRVNILYDRQNTGYYADPNGNSRFANLHTDATLLNWPGYNGISQAYGNYLWPGRNDGSGASWQQSWYLASHSSYGLYTNTGLYAAGPLYTSGGLYVSGVWYDWDNTGYYVNPNSTSRINYIISDNIYSYGWIQSGTAMYAPAFYYNSDESLKKDVKTISNALDDVLKLRGVEFNWRKDGKADFGVVAQEVEKVYPELVSTDEITGLKSVEYGNLIGPIIEAIRELTGMVESVLAVVGEIKDKLLSHDSQIDSLKATVAAQQEAIDALQQKVETLTNK
jgi:hypothetical protein